MLATAAQAKADYLVTGDKQLVKRERRQRVQIVSARQFVEILWGEAEQAA